MNEVASHTLREIDWMLRCIAKRQNTSIAFEASLHGAKINIPSADDSDPIIVDEKTELAMSRMMEEKLMQKQREKSRG